MKLLTAVVPCALISAFAITPRLLADTRMNQPQPPPLIPWFTGPLLAPTGTALPKGHYCIQPFLTLGVVTGVYNSHWKPVSNPHFYSISLQLQTQIGLTEFMDIQWVPEVFYNRKEGQSSILFGDLPFIFDFQLVSDRKFKWFPGIKLEMIETFPTGKYQNLNPFKRGTDISGLGSFSTTSGLVLYKVYHIHKHHFLSMTASYEYTYFAPAHLKGLNFYGGGFGTRGKIYPGALSSIFLSFEYTLTQNWVLALDNVYLHNNKDRFKGNPGITATGAPATTGRPSSEQLSFAPAIEYNFNPNLGLITGIWFTASGRNAFKFCNSAVSFVCAY
jgi:hypothetical protein